MQTERDKVDGATRALVVGLGITGLSVARWLTARGISAAITDTRERPPQLDAVRQAAPDMALFLGGFSRAALERADLVVLSPGVPRTDPFIAEAIAAGIPVVGDIELFARHVDAPVLAVTGSNGKSTVATLLAMMVERSGRTAAAGGNLGTPVLDLLAGPRPDFYVLELSSFQLESTESLKPLAAAVLNLSPDHMDRYPSVDQYAAAKARIWQRGGTIVVNRDDALLMQRVPEGAPRVTFGPDAPPGAADFGLVERSGVTWLAVGDTPLVREDALCINGRHNTANVLAALAMGTAAGIDQAAMIEAARTFRGLPNRMEFVVERNGVRWYNDSKATNVGATLAAISGMAGMLVPILGGDGKGQDFSALAPVMERCARGVVVIGRDRARIVDALGGTTRAVLADDMGDAVRAADSIAQSGDVVLLSPACSSLDMFENFEARGRAFVNAVRSLA